MFRSPASRFVLRCLLYGAGAFLVSVKASSLGSPLTGYELMHAAIDGCLAALAYGGIGAVSRTVEPNIGRKA